MKYQVQITETLQRVVEIEADSAEHAIRRAENLHHTAQIVLTADDYVCYEINLMDD